MRWRRSLAGFGALLAGALSAACGELAAPPRIHGVVLIGLDTLRADALSIAGHPRETTPVLDALARQGVFFENAISNASLTLPGFVGILSGRYFSNRVFDGKLRLSLVERFRDAGFATAAFTEGGYVSRGFGFERGFDHFTEERARVIAEPSPDTGIAKTFGEAREWLRENGARPFFLFVHTYEVHVPYQRRRFAEGLPMGALDETFDLRDNFGVVGGRIPVGETEIAYVRALYDGGVAEADAEVGRLLETLDELGLRDRTLVAVTSDHGEELGERIPSDLGRHGHALWDTLLRVPLIVSDPRLPPRRVADQVRTVDVLPTLLELAGLEADPRAAGRSLVPLMRGEPGPERPAYAEVQGHRGAPRQAALRQDGYKLIWRDGGPGRAPHLALYDLLRDPGETRDLADRDPERVGALARSLRGIQGEVGGGGPIAPQAAEAMDDEVRARLEALGYLHAPE